MPSQGFGLLRTELGRLDHTERRVSWSRHGELEEVRLNQAGPTRSRQCRVSGCGVQIEPPQLGTPVFDKILNLYVDLIIIDTYMK